MYYRRLPGPAGRCSTPSCARRPSAPLFVIISIIISSSSSMY